MIQQSPQSRISNPAIEHERVLLEKQALDALRKWVKMNPFERAFSFDLDRAAEALIDFEERHFN